LEFVLYGRLVYFVVIWYILLVWYILRSVGIFSPFWFLVPIGEKSPNPVTPRDCAAAGISTTDFAALGN
jgi:hypothetical protein